MTIMGPLVLCHSSQSLKTACGEARRIRARPFARTWLCIFDGIVANYNVGPQLEMKVLEYDRRHEAVQFHLFNLEKSGLERQQQ